MLLATAVQAQTSLASGPSRLREQLRYVAQHYAKRLVLVVVADERPLDEADEVVVRRLHAQHEMLWFTVEDADPTAAGLGDDAVDVGDDAVLAPEVRGDARLQHAYREAAQRQREALDATLERHGIVHARLRSGDEVLSALFRALERQRRRGR